MFLACRYFSEREGSSAVPWLTLVSAYDTRLKPAHRVLRNMFPQPALHRNMPFRKKGPLGYKICLRAGNGSVQILIFAFTLPQTVHILARTNKFSGWSLCKMWPAWVCEQMCFSWMSRYSHAKSSVLCRGENTNSQVRLGWDIHSYEQIYQNRTSLLSPPAAAALRSQAEAKSVRKYLLGQCNAPKHWSTEPSNG